MLYIDPYLEEEEDDTEDTPETEKAIRSIRRAMENLNKQLAIIRKQHPNAQYYMACNTLNLLYSDAHEDETPVQGDNIIISELIHHADCGDW